MQKLSIAIAGCGKFGSQMADLLSGLLEYEIVAVCDSDWDRARATGEKFGVRCFKSYEECLAQLGAAAILILTPNSLHCPMTVQAAKAGKHIFCEKPMAMNVEECYRMIDAAEVRLMVGHKRRLRPQYVKMAETVRSGRFGRVLAVNINGFFLRDLETWWRRRDTGGGLLQCAGVHDIDFLRSICSEASSASAATTRMARYCAALTKSHSGRTAYSTSPIRALAGWKTDSGTGHGRRRREGAAARRRPRIQQWH